MEFLGLTLHGWCSPEKATYLRNWIANNKPIVIVEVGVYGGASLIPMAYEARKNGVSKVVGIDPFTVEACLEGMAEPHNREWWAKHSHLSPIKRSCMEALKELNLFNVELWEGTSDHFKDSFQDEEIGLLSVDGNHGPQVLRDVVHYYGKVKPGGLIAMDDTDWVEGGIYYVQQAIGWLKDQGCRFLACIDGCTMLEKPGGATSPAEADCPASPDQASSEPGTVLLPAPEPEPPTDCNSCQPDESVPV